jgi:hypothetical protein
MATIGALSRPTTSAPLPMLPSNAQWTRRTPTAAHRPTDTPGIRDIQKPRSSHSANPSRNIFRTHFALNGSHTGNRSDLTPGPLRLPASLHTTSPVLHAFQGHLGPV